MRKKSIFIIGLFVLLMSSCQKESHDYSDLSYKIVENQNGIKMLEFKDYDAFKNAISSRENDEFLNTLSETHGFTSFYSRYIEFLDKVNDEQLTEESDYKKLLSDYADVITMEADMILPKFNHPLYLHLINTEGMVRVGNRIIAVTENEEIISLDGDKTLLRNALNSKESNDAIYRYTYKEDLKFELIPIHCGSYHFKRYTRQNGKRAVNLYCYVTMDYDYNSSTGWTEYTTTVSFVGLPFRKNIWNNWVGYKANNHLDFTFETRTNSGIYYSQPWTYFGNSNRDRIQYDKVVASGLHYGNGQYTGNYQGNFHILDITYRSSGIPVEEIGAVVKCPQ